MEDLRSCKPHLVSLLAVSFQKNPGGFTILLHSKPSGKWFVIAAKYYVKNKKKEGLLKFCSFEDFQIGWLIGIIFYFYASCLMLLTWSTVYFCYIRLTIYNYIYISKKPHQYSIHLGHSRSSLPHIVHHCTWRWNSDSPTLYRI